MLTIGNLELSNPFILAPLAGFTDKTLRTLCQEQGASLTFTEMVSGKGLKYGDRKTRKLLELEQMGQGDVHNVPDFTIAPTGFQLFGSEPEILAFAAEELAAEGNAVLDLNCGCPVPKIVKNGEGSALLKNLDLLHDCVAAMVLGARKGAEELNRKRGDKGCRVEVKPVTAKIRMGFERDDNVAVEAAKAIEAAGAAAVTVHGRTRQQYYEGKADWEVIAEVKKAVNIPVIGNGDVRTGEDAIRMMDETGCDGVMIARGALGNPWIFRDAIALFNGEELPECVYDSEKVLILVRHLHMLAEDKGEKVAVCEIRKFVGPYTKGMRGAAALRRETNTIGTMDEMIEILMRYRAELER